MALSRGYALCETPVARSRTWSIRCLPPERAKNCGEEYQQIKFAFEKTILPFVDQEQMAKVRERQWFQPAELQGTTAFKSLPFCNDFGAKRRDKMCRRGITKILGWECAG